MKLFVSFFLYACLALSSIQSNHTFAMNKDTKKPASDQSPSLDANHVFETIEKESTVHNNFLALAFDRLERTQAISKERDLTIQEAKLCILLGLKIKSLSDSHYFDIVDIFSTFLDKNQKAAILEAIKSIQSDEEAETPSLSKKGKTPLLSDQAKSLIQNAEQFLRNGNGG